MTLSADERRRTWRHQCWLLYIIRNG